MSGKDPELSRLGEALSSARAAYAAAKKKTDETKAHLNETGSRIQTFNAKIADLKKSIDAEYNAMRSERAAGDRDAAEGHRTAAQAMQEDNINNGKSIEHRDENAREHDQPFAPIQYHLLDHQLYQPRSTFNNMPAFWPFTAMKKRTILWCHGSFMAGIRRHISTASLL